MLGLSAVLLIAGAVVRSWLFVPSEFLYEDRCRALDTNERPLLESRPRAGCRRPACAACATRTVALRPAKHDGPEYDREARGLLGNHSKRKVGGACVFGG